MKYSILEDTPKGYTYDQDKLIPPEQTVRNLKKRLASLDLDILRRTRRIDNGRIGIPVFYSECGKDARHTIGTKKQMGKGGTPAQAEASSIMELIERFSLFSFVKNKNNFYTATFSQAGKKAIDFSQIIASVNDNENDALKIKPVFDQLPLEWINGYNLTKQKEQLIPFRWFYMINEFNGSSAGNCKEEAISQGICEIIERHVCALVSEQNLSVPAIELSSFNSPIVLEMLEKYQACNIHIQANDFSLDTGIPTLAVLAFDPCTFPCSSEIIWTAGSAPDPEKAMSRALSEIAQLAGDFNTNSCYEASGLPKLHNIEDAKFLTNPYKILNCNALPDLSSNNIKTEIENMLNALGKNNNFQTFTIDITNPYLEVPAFYTIVPGTHFRERAANASVGLFTARLIIETKQLSMASHMMDNIQKIFPNQAYPYFYKGMVLHSLGNYQKSFKNFEQALSRNSHSGSLPDICSHMAVCLKDMEQFSRAIDLCRQGLAADDSRPDLFNTMGVCYFMSHDYENAMKYFQKALGIDPSIAINYANMGSCCRELGQKYTAIKYYATALSIDPSIEFAKENIRRLQ